MNELVFKSEKGSPITTSLLVAEKFEKNHKDVLKAIRNLECSNDFHERNFAPMFYTSELGNGATRKDPCTVMTRDGFAFLAMGFTGTKAAKFKEDFINAFNKMEKSLKNQLPQTYAEALRQLAEQVEESEKQKQIIEEQKPKVLFADAVATSDDSCLVGELAKILRQKGVEIGQNRLFAWMRENGYLCRYRERYNQPTQISMEMGLIELKKTPIIKPDGVILVTVTPKITGKGQIHFVNKFLKNKQIA